jgi:hypothetical protein
MSTEREEISKELTSLYQDVEEKRKNYNKFYYQYRKKGSKDEEIF